MADCIISRVQFTLIEITLCVHIFINLILPVPFTKASVMEGCGRPASCGEQTNKLKNKGCLAAFYQDQSKPSMKLLMKKKNNEKIRKIVLKRSKGGERGGKKSSTEKLETGTTETASVFRPACPQQNKQKKHPPLGLLGTGNFASHSSDVDTGAEVNLV